MLRKLLSAFGIRIEYVCEWGVYSHRYDGIDYAMGRPIHREMSVAPPWARLKLVRSAQKGGDHG